MLQLPLTSPSVSASRAEAREHARAEQLESRVRREREREVQRDVRPLVQHMRLHAVHCADRDEQQPGDRDAGHRGRIAHEPACVSAQSAAPPTIANSRAVICKTSISSRMPTSGTAAVALSPSLTSSDCGCRSTAGRDAEEAEVFASAAESLPAHAPTG